MSFDYFYLFKNIYISSHDSRMQDKPRPFWLNVYKIQSSLLNVCVDKRFKRLASELCRNLYATLPGGKHVSCAFGVKEVEETNSTVAVRNKRFKLDLYLNFPLNFNYLSRNKVTPKK
jgi:hypothetical protein